jgi:hypothetical protein
MRPILPSDLDQAARALLTVPQAARPAAMGAMLAAADLADRHRKRTGRMHPAYGDGSLIAVILKQPRLPARFCDPAYCAAMQVVLSGIAIWRDRQNATGAPFLRDDAPLSVARSLRVGGQHHGDSETQPGRS